MYNLTILRLSVVCHKIRYAQPKGITESLMNIVFLPFCPEFEFMRACVIGASGGIGSAIVSTLDMRGDVSAIVALSRSGDGANLEKVERGKLDILDEESIIGATKLFGGGDPFDLVIVTTGILSNNRDLQPEKSFRQQSLQAYETVFSVNTFGPALVAKHFLPLMPKSGRSVFAALSARVGSISDNRLGGWHAYRSSKAALNMLIRNFAIEQARQNPDFIAVALHPGTVDTGLSRPFQSNVSSKRLFTPKQSAIYILDVIDGLNSEDSGKHFDWAGKEILA